MVSSHRRELMPTQGSRRPQVRRGLLAAALLLGMLGHTSDANAAGTRPLFKAPWDCNVVFDASTYSGHANRGVDFNNLSDGSDANMPVRASAPGIARLRSSSGYGNYVDIAHGGGWTTRYAHLRDTPTLTDRDPSRSGVQVWTGDVIGRIGGTGGVPPHLHYEQLAEGVGVAVAFEGRTISAGTSYTSSDPNVRSLNCGRGLPRQMSSGGWTVTNSLQPHVETGNRTRFTFGSSVYMPVVGDWDGDGDDTAGVFNPATGLWVLTNSRQPHVDTGDRIRFTFADSTYLPVVGDWDGNGTDTPGVFRPSNGAWVLTNSLRPHVDTGNRIRFTFGNSSYLPVAGNWDGHAGDNPGVFNPSNGQWVLTNSLQPHIDTGNRIRFTFGNGGMVPLAGNWDGFGGDNAGVAGTP